MLGGRLCPRHRDRTLGFTVEEYVLAAGDPVYVVGQARTDLGDLVITKPPMQPLIVSRTAPVPVSDGQD
jgi:hypothetical protein